MARDPEHESETGSGERFLERWARRKREIETAPQAGPPPAESTEQDGELEAKAQEELVASLPDIETLDETSDFKAFMQKGVPEALQRRALRKLWRLNPVIASVDGLNDYDDDFTDAATVIEGMKTLFQAGKGMRSEEADAARREIAEAEQAEAEQAEADADAGAEGETLAEEPDGEETAEAEVAELAEPRLEGPDEHAGLLVSDETEPGGAEREVGPEQRPRGSGRSAVARRWGLTEA